MFPLGLVKIYEVDVLNALYILSPIGARSLANYFELKLGKFDVDSLNTALARLIDKAAITSQTVEGVTLWGLPGTWM